MTNPQKAKGDRAEVALVNYLQQWWPNVRRTKAGGEKDLGDLSGLVDCDGDEWCVQVADRAVLGREHGAVIRKAAEAGIQAQHMGAPLWCLVVKRPGCADPGQWFVWMPMWALIPTVADRCLPHEYDPTLAGWLFNGVPPDDLGHMTVRAWVALIAPEPF